MIKQLNSLTLLDDTTYYIPGGIITVEVPANNSITTEKYFKLCQYPQLLPFYFALELEQETQKQSIQGYVDSLKNIYILSNSLPKGGAIQKIGFDNNNYLWFSIIGSLGTSENFVYKYSHSHYPNATYAMDKTPAKYKTTMGGVSPNTITSYGNIIFGTDAPPKNNNYPQGTIYVQYSS